MYVCMYACIYRYISHKYIYKLTAAKNIEG